MNNKIRLSVVIALILGSAIATWRYFSPSSDTAGEARKPAEDSPTNPGALAGLAAGGMGGEEAIRLLSDPRVKTYFQKEKDKRALDAYFNGGDGSPGDEEAWRLIESIEAEGRMTAYEALALKLAWLERNSDDRGEFDRAAAELVESYRQKSQRSVEEYDPYEDVPGFAEYKEMEAQIVQEVQQMSTFPDGMSKHEYLRKRLQAAREKAYSNAQ